MDKSSIPFSLDACYQNYQQAAQLHRDLDTDIDQKIAKLNAQKKKIVARIENIQRLKDKNPFPNWVQLVIQPIADQLKLFYPDAVKIEVYGPFGLNNQTSIHVNLAVKPDGSKDTLLITFRPQFDENDKITLTIVDYDHPIDSYPVGSIGEMNGMNYPDLPMVETMENLVAYMNRNK